MVLSATQAQALRCGSELVSREDHLVEVLRKCGDPSYVTTWIERRSYRVYHHHYPYYRDKYGDVSIEEWIYNFGPQRFMQLLRFENGRLKKIRSLDYGY
jgi:hypothetical protein